jgi:putative ATP-binding cassette transporter
MSLLRFLFRHARGVALAASACGLVSGGMSAAFIQLIARSLRASDRPPPWLLLLTLAVALTTYAASQLLLNRLSEGAVYELRLELGRRLLAVPLRELEGLGKHRLLAALTDDVTQIAAGLSNFPTLCSYGATLLVCFGVLAWQSPLTFVIWAAVLSLGSVSYHLLQRRALAELERGRVYEDELYGHFTALCDGARELRNNRQRRYDFFHGSLERAARGQRDQLRRGLDWFTLARSLGDGLYLSFLFAFVTLLPGALGMNGELRGRLLLLMIYSMTPLVVLVNLLPIFARATVADRNLQQIGLALSSHVGAAEQPVLRSLAERPLDSAGPSFQRLELHGVTFSYAATGEREGFEVGPLDLEFRRGEVVFLCGGNGSGKTTLAKIVAGLYPPSGGRILVDGVAVSESSADEYRQLFSAVWFDFHLFRELPDSARNHGASRRLLERLELASKVQLDRAGRLSTTELSQGQRKRLALFAAWLENRPFLVFDEWAADQDPEFRRFFYEELLGELRAMGKTVLALSHDDRYFHVADRLLCLECGVLQPINRQLPQSLRAAEPLRAEGVST